MIRVVPRHQILVEIETEGRHVDVVCRLDACIDVFRLETNIRNHDDVPLPTQKNTV